MKLGIEWIDKRLLLLLGVKDIPKESEMLGGKKGMFPYMKLMTIMRTSSIMMKIKLQCLMGADLNQGEKGVVVPKRSEMAR